MSSQENEPDTQEQGSTEAEVDTSEEQILPEAELTLEQQLEEANAEVEKYKDMALRAEAEMHNVRRRAERDVENAHRYGIEKFLQNLLPAVDGIEKAVEAAVANQSDDNDPIVEGIKLCQKLLLDVLEKEKVEIVDPEGQPFDPNEHQAMSMIEHAEMEPNSVLQVVQKGYRLNSRLVRPAMVMVTKAPETKDTPAEP